jgi:methylglutaconyl-CoA hydratase
MKENTILSEIDGSIGTIWLNRPAKQNALDFQMISSFLSSLRYLESLPQLRIIVIRGKGKSFCSGADLEWMYRSAALSYEDNFRECETLARCFFEVYTSKKITICITQGSCMGGGNGFVSSADIVIAADSSIFAFSEVRIGLIPATILPYVLQKTGRAIALEKVLSGAKFNAEEAFQIKLINRIVSVEQLDDSCSALTGDLLQGEPGAQQKIKSIINTPNLPIDERLITTTAKTLADARITPEAIEGMNSFLSKRKPVWNKELSKMH